MAGIGKLPKGGYAAGLDSATFAGARVGLYGTGWRSKPISAETQALYDAAVGTISGLGATTVADPFAGTGFSDLALNMEFDDRGLESIVYDLETFLRRLGPSAAATSFAALKALLPEDPFASDKLLGVHAKKPVLAKSLTDATVPPDLSEFLAARQAYLAIFERVMADNQLDVLVFPQMSDALPGIFSDATYPATTVSEINIAGLPGVTVPAGQYGNGAPFALILVGPLWSEARLLGYAHAYEQASHKRIVPQLVAEPYAV